MLVVVIGIADQGFAQPSALSPTCERIRMQSIAAYWEATVPVEQAARMIKAISSGNAETSGAALVGEVLAGPVTVQQLGAGTLAGTDAVYNPALCGESDRQIAKDFRLMLPGLMIKLAEQVSAKRNSKQ